MGGIHEPLCAGIDASDSNCRAVVSVKALHRQNQATLRVGVKGQWEGRAAGGTFTLVEHSSITVGGKTSKVRQ